MAISRALVRATLLVPVLALASCYTPDGGLMPTSGRGFTYISTPSQPLTIKLVNICKLDAADEPEVFREWRLAPGRQLTFKFLHGQGDNASERPDQLLWEEWEAGTTTGSLRNQMPCPPSVCRRIDVEIRQPEPLPVEDDSKDVNTKAAGESRQPDKDPREIYDP
jgi:hypothetical protein